MCCISVVGIQLVILRGIADDDHVFYVSYLMTQGTVVSYSGYVVPSGVGVLSELPVRVFFQKNYVTNLVMVRNTFRVFCRVVFVYALLFLLLKEFPICVEFLYLRWHRNQTLVGLVARSLYCERLLASQIQLP